MTALIWAATALGITAIIAFSALRAWRGWLDLQRYAVAADHSAPEAPDRTPGLRIEMADLRERLRKLEAIAHGVDL